MSISDHIAAIRSNNNKTERHRTLDIYSLKCRALLEVILDAPLIGRTFTRNGTTSIITSAGIASQRDRDGDIVETLGLVLNMTRGPIAVTHTVYFTNPPVFPSKPTGDERQDLIQTVSEMIFDLPVE